MKYLNLEEYFCFYSLHVYIWFEEWIEINFLKLSWEIDDLKLFMFVRYIMY